MINKPREQGREAFQQRAWKDAYDKLSKAHNESPLDAKDLELLASAAYLTGKSSESNAIWSRAHSAYLKGGDTNGAIRCAFLISFTLFHIGEYARGGGWYARARSLMDKGSSDCVEKGYLLLLVALQFLNEEDDQESLTTFEQVGKIADRHRDRDLMTLSRLGRGHTLVRLGEKQEGVRLLDEAMAAVDAGEISPIFVGIIYCTVIETCHEIFDLNRAYQWTEALTDWCEGQPQLIPFRGECLVRRSQIMQLHGKWPKAIEEAGKAIEFLTSFIPWPATRAAFYQFGELHRLRGEFVKAEEAYRQAINWGRKINPGLALLRLAQGDIKSAEKCIESGLKESTGISSRSRVLPAFIEIMLAANNAASARQAADELTGIANSLNAALINGLAAMWEGAVLLHERKTQKALAQLHNAGTIFEKLAAPYEMARVRLLIGKAYQALGDTVTAKMEFQAARSVFQQLGAIPDAEQAESFLSGKRPGNLHGLSHREMEVLCLIVRGLTNRAIADELFISERTVERHVSNIFIKMDVSSRSAVTAYAYDHKLV